MKKDQILNKYKTAAATGTKTSPYSWLNYQPINLPGYEETLELGGRDCFDRSKAILEHLQHGPAQAALTNVPKPLKVIDWGCNLGFFSFEALKVGHAVTGVDSNKEFIDICSSLAEDNSFNQSPDFFVDTLTAESIKKYPADVAFCFSVLHHILAKSRVEAWNLIRVFSKAYPIAYIEMDGPNFGKSDLSLFYFYVSEIAESNDRYGSGVKKRKTLYCSNIDPVDGARYVSIKEQNKVFNRDVFLKTLPDKQTVIKREKTGGAFGGGYSHTWIKTNLAHEKYIYGKYESDFFPNVLAWNVDDAYTKMEMEYFKREGEITLSGLNAIYDFLKENNLFIIDLVRDMFIPTKNGLRLIDVESIFEIEGDISNTIKKNTKETKRNPYDTYDKQINVLKQIYKL
ncbi:MAG: hypothetical protein CMI54_05785 [Parcubacteria group bacterium]|nr:hypothetical protein [Parcubacteria group bacterium]